MKKNGMLNSDITKVLADMGHTDLICIADCGLPIPNSVNKIDLALDFKIPSFMEVFNKFLQEMAIQKVYLAKEIQTLNPYLLKEIEIAISNSNQQISLEFIDHESLKKQEYNCKAVVRTGENTPYANIILESAVIF